MNLIPAMVLENKENKFMWRKMLACTVNFLQVVKCGQVFFRRRGVRDHCGKCNDFFCWHAASKFVKCINVNKVFRRREVRVMT